MHVCTICTYIIIIWGMTQKNIICGERLYLIFCLDIKACKKIYVNWKVSLQRFIMDISNADLRIKFIFEC